VLDAPVGIRRLDPGCVECSPGAQHELVQLQDRLAQPREVTGCDSGLNGLRHDAIMYSQLLRAPAANLVDPALHCQVAGTGPRIRL